MDDPKSLGRSSAGRVLLDDRYELIELVGSGGMAEVWRARDRRLERDVAVKLLSSSSAKDPSRRRRIEREARALAATSHPNIVAVFDYGEAKQPGGDVRPYLAMELVDGPDLDRYLTERGALPVGEALDVMVGVLSAVALAHSSGVVHGDLKPANVFIGPHGPKVGDFGVARILDEETGMTTAAATPSFAAPEVLKGERPTSSSDVYSVSCLAFQLLTGRPPYDGGNGWEIASKHMDAPIPRVKDFRSDVPVALQVAVERGMEKEPRRRHADANAFAEALSRVPVVAPGATVPVVAGMAGAPVAERTQSLGTRPDLRRAALWGPLAVWAGRADSGARSLSDRIAHSRHKGAMLTGLIVLLLLFGALMLREPGAASAPVPKMTGLTYDAASAMLRQANLRVGKVSYHPVAQGEVGRVVRTYPKAGTEVPEGTKVDLVATVLTATPAPPPLSEEEKKDRQKERRERRGSGNGGDD